MYGPLNPTEAVLSFEELQNLHRCPGNQLLDPRRILRGVLSRRLPSLPSVVVVRHPQQAQATLLPESGTTTLAFLMVPVACHEISSRHR